MVLNDTLTNEKLNRRFENPFALVNYAISLAKVKVLRGEGIDSNPATDVLEIIAEGKDLIETDKPENSEQQP